MIPVLITFPPSIDSETSRFIIDHYGIKFQESRHTLLFSFFATLWHGYTFKLPLFYSDAFKIVGPRAIVDYFDPRSALDRKLLPTDAADLRQVESDWILFNGTLGFATAAFAYYYLLPYRDHMIRPLTEGVPDLERRAVEGAYPLFAGLLKLLLQLSLSKAQQSLTHIRSIFESVDARLPDGQQFLVGGSLTLSDVAFAVAAAPVLLPPGYGGPMPSFEEMPPEVQAAVTEMQSHPAGEFALRIYREYRRQYSLQ